MGSTEERFRWWIWFSWLLSGFCIHHQPGKFFFEARKVPQMIFFRWWLCTLFFFSAERSPSVTWSSLPVYLSEVFGGPLGDPLGGRLSSRRLSVLLPLIVLSFSKTQGIKRSKKRARSFFSTRGVFLHDFNFAPFLGQKSPHFSAKNRPIFFWGAIFGANIGAKKLKFSPLFAPKMVQFFFHNCTKLVQKHGGKMLLIVLTLDIMYFAAPSPPQKKNKFQ